MKRAILCFALAVPFLCLAIPAHLSAEDAAFYAQRAWDWLKKGDYDKAIQEYNEAIRLKPDDAESYYGRGYAWNEKHEYDKAIADCSEAIRFKPDFANAYVGRGIAWEQKHQYDKAIKDYDQAIRLKPDFVESYLHRAYAWYNKDKYDKAIKDYNEALRLKPDYAEAYNNLAWLHATCPEDRYRDGKQAVVNAKHAHELDGGKTWRIIGTLAAAYAEDGQFEKAVEWQKKAIDLSARDKLTAEKNRKELRGRLEIYKQKKPYHEEAKKK